MKDDKTSLLYWYPKIKDLGIPTPKTKIIVIKATIAEIYDMLDGKKECITPQLNEFKEIAKSIGYPLFLRTDYTSSKHSWKKACYVENEKYLAQHIFNLYEFSCIADFYGLPINALVFREYIEMNALFKAFLDLPINSEKRYFIRNGIIENSYSYWFEDVFEKYQKNLPKNWKELLKKINTITIEENKLLDSYANKVANILDGYWSLDFCKAKEGTWYLIDMADGDKSWRPTS